MASLRGSVWILARLSIDRLACFWPARRKLNEILIVRIDRLGDFILWIDAAQTLARSLRRDGMRITLLANGQWADWARQLRIFDEVIGIDVSQFSSSLGYRMRAEIQLRRRRFSKAIQPTYTRHWVSGDALIRTCGAPERIGSAGEPEHKGPFHRPLGDRWYTRLIPAQPGCLFEIDRNAEFLSALVSEPVPARIADLRASGLRVPSPVVREVIEQARPYFVLIPGASLAGKRWPIASYLEIAERLHTVTGWNAIVCGGDEDLELGEAFCRRPNGAITNLAGKTTIADLVTILLHARIVIGNDTASIHLAAAVKTPSVCVLGGGQFDRFLPYRPGGDGGSIVPTPVFHRMDCFQCNWNCPYATADLPYPCVKSVAVDDVWKAVASRVVQGTGFSLPMRRRCRTLLVAAG
jgi:ADP-heptose:LPS heptosyltransferase